MNDYKQTAKLLLDHLIKVANSTTPGHTITISIDDTSYELYDAAVLVGGLAAIVEEFIDEQF